MELSLNLSKILKTISSPIKIRILNLLCKQDMSLNEIHSIIFKEFEIKYPQTTYNYIESLVSSDIIKKVYDQDEKLIKYRLIGKNLNINFEKISFKLK